MAREGRLEEEATMSYTIEFANGETTESYDEYDAAVAAVEARYPDAEIGHDGDLSEGGDRTLCWRTEADSVDDDGKRSVCAIYKMEDAS
jgi:hypothetical protein